MSFALLVQNNNNKLERCRHIPKIIPSEKHLFESIKTCIKNGEHLLDDAVRLEFQKPPTGKLIFSMLAQEEFAKGFILYLVKERIIEWNSYLLRAINNHSCKQLVGIVIEYIHPKLDETIDQIKERIARDVSLGNKIPTKVTDAIAILRYEKIGRWENNNWCWAETPEYDPQTIRISKGSRDRIRQDAIYVRLGKNGCVLSKPLDTNHSICDSEYDRANDYCFFIKDLVEKNKYSSPELIKINNYFRVLFSSTKN